MDLQPNDKNQPHIVQIMMTEHYNLQSGRSITVSDAGGRSSLFLSTVSSTLIALAFIGNISHLGTAFFVFALVIFPSLLFLGLVTFERVLQSAIEDVIYARGINRIRHLYVELAPQVQDYFILSTHDDRAGTFLNLAILPSWLQLLVTTAGMISVINSILAGAFIGLLVYQLFVLSLLLCMGAANGVFLVILAAHLRYQRAVWQSLVKRLKVLFPSDAQQQ